MLKMGSLFSGIGGLDLGLERGIPGLKTIWQVEQEPFCQKVLAKHWPEAKIYDDVRNITKENVEPVDILCGGFPCQDLSVAGKGEGLNGKKSGFYWEMWRIIGELRPRIVVMENVPVITIRGLDSVLGSLSQIGYDAEWCVISARDFGAPHLRKRWFCVTYPLGYGSKVHFGRGFPVGPKGLLGRGPSPGDGGKYEHYWKNFPIEPPFRNRNDGLPNGLARIKALGNAVVPQCAQWVGEQIFQSGLLNDLYEERK